MAWATAKLRTQDQFLWGITDCAALWRDSWRVQFDRDVLPLPVWDSASSARRVWQTVQKRYGGIPELMAHVGARPILPLRTRGVWPIGAVLFLGVTEHLPSFATVVDQNLALESAPELGVHGVVTATMNTVQAAWLLEQTEVADG